MIKGLSLLLRQEIYLNNLDDTDVLFPARYPSVIAVGSVDENLKRSSFSYYGNGLEFVAPGEKIRSTYIENWDLDMGINRDIYGSTICSGIAALYSKSIQS